MRVLRSELFPIEPQAAKRSTQTQTWLTKVPMEEAIAIDASYTMAFNSKGKPYWWKEGKDGKVKKLRSKPAYAKTKTFLDKYFKYKDDLKAHGEKVGFIMPQDAFFMWFYMPMPDTWTKKKKAAMTFKMHKNKKDTDNLSKAIKDALAPRKSNFTPGAMPAMDDRVISSYANAKIYTPGEWVKQPDGEKIYTGAVGTLIVEYDLNEFLQDFFKDAAALMQWTVDFPVNFKP
jgi:Endodeoxyribonuclease RusA